MSNSGNYTLDQAGQGAVVLRCPGLEIPGVEHGFATRLGGVSPGARASLNFGIKSGDPLSTILENQRRLGARLGLDPGRFYRQTQVHGRRVQLVTGEEDPQQVWQEDSDALVSDTPGCGLGVVTADCVPLLLASRLDGRRAVAAVHAGWRGIVGGVIQATLARLTESFGCQPGDLVAATGPCIGPCCYQVGEEVAGQFSGIPGAVVPQGEGARPHLDLPAAVSHVLGENGVQVSHAGLCTRCREDLFYSYRRDAAGTGLQMSVIALV